MNKNLFSFIAFMLLVSCGTGISSRNNQKEINLNEAILVAEKAEAVDTVIFLGFKFGMTNEQVVRHLEDLEDEGQVYTDSRGRYAYDFHTGQTALKLGFSPKYHEGGLYQLDFILNNHENSIGTPVLNTVLAAKTFMETDRKEFQTFITEDLLGETVYTFIKNNLIIQFETPANGIMSYINAPMAHVVREQKNAEKDSAKNRTLSDF